MNIIDDLQIQKCICKFKNSYANKDMHMQIINWICISWSADAYNDYNPMHIIKLICIKSNTLWIDISKDIVHIAYMQFPCIFYRSIKYARVHIC